MTNPIKDILLQKIQEEQVRPRAVSHPPLHRKPGKIGVVSLFCGAGGLDLGLEWAGIEARTGKPLDFWNKDAYNRLKEQSLFHTFYAIDSFKEALHTYQRHFPDTVTQQVDIRDLRTFPKADMLVFGFPCPGFSAAGPRLIDDPRNFLYVHCCRALVQTQPKIFVAENVKGILSLEKGEAFRQIKEDFEAAGYQLYTKLVNAADYGVPQSRERVVFVGVRHDVAFTYTFPEETHGKGRLPYRTMRDAIADLEQRPGPYHEGGYSSQFMSRNRKRRWDQPSYTIQAGGRHAPLHPGGKPMVKVAPEQWAFAEGEQMERRISLKEAARLQTFPDWFDFSLGAEDVSPNTYVGKGYTQIGNAVPPLLARCIIKPIADFFLRECKQPSAKTK